MQDPHLYQIEPSQGADSAIVFVTGFRTKKRYLPEHHKPWIDSLRASDGVAQFIISGGILERQNFLFKKSKIGRDINVVQGALEKLYLEKMVVYKVKESSVTLIGHSLGARVIFFAMRGCMLSHHTSLRTYIF